MTSTKTEKKPATDQEIDISVLIAVCNVEQYLPQCLESIAQQTYKKAEFIIIDDGSTDLSSEICEKYRCSDDRFTVFHQSNQGLVAVRKRGIKLARGKWTIFVDGDDFLPSSDVLATEVELAEKHNVDILRFCIDIIGTESQKEGYLKFRGNFIGLIESPNEMISKIFGQRGSISWVQWDKIYRSSVLKQVAPFIEDIYVPCATDLYCTFLTCFFASSFRSVETKPMYSYRLGTGVSSGNVTLTKYKKYAQEPKLIGLLERFLKSQNVLEEYRPVLKALERRLVATAVQRYVRLKQDDADEGFELLLNNNPIELVVENLFRIYQNTPAELANRISMSPFIKCNKGEIRTIAIYFHCYNSGGVQKGISYQLPMFLSLGYKVVLITEDKDYGGEEYPTPKGVIRVTIPAEYEKGRVQALEQAIRGNNIDVILYHAASSNRLLFDLIPIKVLKRNVIVFLHELTTQSMTCPSAFFGAMPHLYRLSDALVVMSSMELDFYRNHGVPAYYIPNFITVDIGQPLKQHKSEETKTVLWVGRLDNAQKNYREALEIMAMVIKEVPNAVCIIVGRGKPKDVSYVENYIQRNDFKNKIEYVGDSLNPKEYYLKADVHLVTSTYESFCRVIAESKSYGVPLVLYDMPYLEILKDKRGYVSVKRHNKKAACAAITTLLNDDIERIRLGQEARQSIQDFMNKSGSQPQYWQNLLSKISQGIARDGDALITEEQIKQNLLFWDTSISFLREGINRKSAIEKDLKASLSREKALKQSVSFRVGKAITWLPRKVKGMIRHTR